MSKLVKFWLIFLLFAWLTFTTILLVSLPNIIAHPSSKNPQNASKIIPRPEWEQAFVNRVVDGDTIIAGGKSTRLIGVNTPETVDPRRPVQCFGKKASEFTKNALSQKSVFLEKDVTDKDKYKRNLRYVWIGKEELKNSFGNLEKFDLLEKDGAVLFNEALARLGFAYSSPYPPDVKYQDIILQAQKKAFEENLGLWKECLK